MNGRTDPDEIEVDREKSVLAIRWKDGHASELPFDLLRAECPCAQCAELRQRASGESRPALRVLDERSPRPGRVDIAAITPVGRYGINVRFADGHAFGIYTFDLLRALCPCDACRPDAAT